MVEHEREHTIGEQLHKIANIENSSAIGHNLLDPISTEQENSPEDEHQNGEESHADDNNLHNFGLVDAAEGEYGTREEEQEHPEVELFEVIHF